MPRKPRIEIPGYYHIVNRGVEQRKVFECREDYEQFEALMCQFAKAHNVTIHNYCLMSNHYHLLIEIRHTNLSQFMRQLNMHYAIYFNRRYQRSGHLWQGRFKSWYVTDEAYLYTLMLYIEQNPVKANIVDTLERYPFSSYHCFLNPVQIPECLQDSWVMQHYRDDTEAIRALLNSPVDMDQLNEMKKASALVEAPNIDTKPNIEELRKLLSKGNNTKERNVLICQAYAQGYSQHMTAKVLGLSQQAVCGIVKRGKQ